MSDWKPIETAPKDGTRILIYEQGGAGSDDEVFACVWGRFWPQTQPTPGTGWRENYSEGWVEFGGMDVRQTCDKPTHWMPLPKPPSGI